MVEGSTTQTYYAFGGGADTRTTGRDRLSIRGYRRASSTVTPFLEAEVGRVRLDEDTREIGGRRRGGYQALRLGGMIELAPTIVGELSIGARRDGFADAVADRAGDTIHVSLNGTIVWATGERSRLRLVVATDVRPSGLLDAFSRSTQAALIGFSLRADDDLRLETGAGIVGVDYTGLARHDTTTSAFALADHDISRFMAIVARYHVERTTSDARMVGQLENRLTIVLRLRR